MNADCFESLKLLGSKDVQTILGVSRGFVQKIIKEKWIPCKQTSAGWIFPEEAVLEYQKEREAKAKGDRRVRIKKGLVV